MVRNFINDLTAHPDSSQPVFKSRLDAVKVGFEALQ
jgi:hypothetical protein